MRDYEPPILEAWATWESFRKLGFSSDDLYWVIQNTVNARPKPGLTLSIILKSQGREFSVTCSERLSKNKAARLLDQARLFIADVNANAFDHDEMREVLHGSYLWRNKVDFVTSLLANGFQFPYKNASLN